MNKKLIIIFMVAVLLVAVGIYYFSYRLGFKKRYSTGYEKEKKPAEQGLKQKSEQ